MRLPLFVSASIFFALLQSCGGSGGGQPASNSNQNPEPSDPPNPLGGIWVSEDNSVSFLMTETGRFITQLFLDQSLAGIGTGSGQIDVSDSDDINTQFTISGIVMRPGESDPLPTKDDAFSPHQCSTTAPKTVTPSLWPSCKLIT